MAYIIYIFFKPRSVCQQKGSFENRSIKPGTFHDIYYHGYLCMFQMYFFKQEEY